MRTLHSLLIAFSLLSLLSCSGGGGGGGGGEDQPELFRVVHAAPDNNSFNLRLDGEPIFSDVRFGETTSYTDVTEGTAVQLNIATDESVVPIIDEELEIAAGKNYTLICFEEDGADTMQSVLQEDTNTEPEVGQFRLRFGNLAPTVSSVDLYILNPGVRVADAEPAATGIATNGFSDYFDIDEGEYVIKITDEGTKDVVAQTESQEFLAGDVYSFFIFDKRGGGKPLTYALTLDASF